MAVGTADLHKSIRNAWVNLGLDDVFKSYWSPDDKLNYPSLHDGEATPHQPVPYCVYEVSAGDVTSRMTGPTGSEKRYIKDIPVTFTIHTRTVGNASAKEFGAILLESLLFKFNGHPTLRAEFSPTMDNGAVLLIQYQNDFGMRTGDEEYSWTVEYLFRLDVPVRA